jgi:cell division protein FtsN
MKPQRTEKTAKTALHLRRAHRQAADPKAPSWLPPRQRGGFLLGAVVGLLVGLALALGVALYVTKAPIPFVDKVPQRTPEQDAAEIERNKRWDPNGPLTTKPKPPSVISIQPQEPKAQASAPHPTSTRDPAAILSGQPVSPAAAPMVSPSSGRSANTEAGAFIYFVQTGAFSRPEDAEQQRARLALMGLSAVVTERNQAGRSVYRVRVGPFDRKEDAEATQEKLQAASMETALVRVENASR